MLDCTCLIHPFQNDPGTSQRQRIMEDLLAGAAKIDARTLADLLDYFVQLSGHINYYDFNLNKKDWQPFFRKSIPFAIAAMIKYPVQNAESNLDLYKSIFNKQPTAAGLQLNSCFIFYRFINTINDWQIVLQGSSLPIARVVDELIKNKLQQPVKWFIRYSNAAVKNYGIKKIDFSVLTDNPVWGIDLADTYTIDTSFSKGPASKIKKLQRLYEAFSALIPIFVNAVKSIAKEAEKNLEISFVPLKEELQQQHQPHLALIFAFLNLFRQLQDDLNKYTRKHLDYFYKDILQFKSAAAVADKAHVIFEIQQQLERYLLKKGLLLKDGKDINKQQILFALDDDIVVTKTTIADKRTLFINNKNSQAHTYVEGAYMAPVADMADGVEIPFKEDPKNYPAVGGKYSKYQDPETKLFKPYPNARLGFILASPVLFLQAGSTRTITIELQCELENSICGSLGEDILKAASNCCNDANATGSTVENNRYPEFYAAGSIYPEGKNFPQFNFYNAINDVLSGTYYYINQDILKAAIKKGISAKLADSLKELFLTEKEKALCYCDTKKLNFETTENDIDFNAKIASLQLTKAEKKIIYELIKPRKALSLLFSGEKEWIAPSEVKEIKIMPVGSFSGGAGPDTFTLQIIATLHPEKSAVVPYNKDVLNEDFGTTQPLVKIELDDKIKFSNVAFKQVPKSTTGKDDCCVQSDSCCLLKEEEGDKVSLYHFFRNVLVSEIKDVDKAKPIISVDVCGLKNFIVQNDESVMDVNGPIMAFGARPKIDANFYIGSEEIFLKNWTDLWIDIKWKDLPQDLDAYYAGYQNQYWDATTSSWINDGIVTANNFLVSFSYLEDGNWFIKSGANLCSIDNANYDMLFPPPPLNPGFCFAGNAADFAKLYSHQFYLQSADFINLPATPVEKYGFRGIKKFDVNSRSCFLKLSLKCQDFQHDKYPFVLARQMSAVAKLPELIPGAVYFNIDPSAGGYQVLNLKQLFADVKNSYTLSAAITPQVTSVRSMLFHALNTPSGTPPINLLNKVNLLKGLMNNPTNVNFISPTSAKHYNHLDDAVNGLNTLLQQNNDKIDKFANSGAVIPKEPYTPTIAAMALDYKAFAAANDIAFIHVHPYQNTYRQQELASRPTLFPTFCDEGSLFLGLKDLVPGDNLNILFQLAEATSDTEADKEEVYWYYLDSNVWKPLRKGFEVLDDATKNLTTTGIVKLALPTNMTTDNTIMPKDLHWIKATIAKNSKAVSEAIGIIPQAMLAIFTNEDANDKTRLAQPLPKESIAKLNEADANVKTVVQPYDAFGGAVPENEGQFYVRVSETLRHKGRAIQAFDYERLALQAFPQLFKVKCINHSFALNANEYTNDFPYAPGYVMLAVIPDLNKLNAGQSFEPKVPVSVLEDVETFMRKRTSPFVRFRAMNPRYEKINLCLRVRLIKGKDENYFREKIKQDIREFMAPWAVGVYDKLTFGQCVYRADIIGLLEKSGYTDFIADFKMGKEGDSPSGDAVKICPGTPRTILIAGDIEVCIEKPGCETWAKSYASCKENVQVVSCNNKPEPIKNYCK